MWKELYFIHVPTIWTQHLPILLYRNVIKTSFLAEFNPPIYSHGVPTEFIPKPQLIRLGHDTVYHCTITVKKKTIKMVDV